jgi:acyl-ACP thioesterase
VLHQQPRFIGAPRAMEEVYQSFTDDTKFDIRGNGASILSNDNSYSKYIGADRDTRKTLEDNHLHWFCIDMQIFY